jgi:hypothetical protein
MQFHGAAGFKVLLAAGLLLACAIAVTTLAMSRTVMTWVSSPVTGKVYLVKNAPGKDKVADRLAALELALVKFIKDASAAFPDDARLVRLKRRWDGTLAEVERPGDIAYSLNKRAIHVCVRGPGNTIESFNTTMYVLLHEVAHVCTTEYGHPPIFWDNFRWILEVAEYLGVYVYEDFDASPVTHCGHRLGNNVLSCVRRKECTSALKKR